MLVQAHAVAIAFVGMASLMCFLVSEVKEYVDETDQAAALRVVGYTLSVILIILLALWHGCQS